MRSQTSHSISSSQVHQWAVSWLNEGGLSHDWWALRKAYAASANWVGDW